MDVNCVLCAVGTEFLCAMQAGFIPQPCHCSVGYLSVSHRKDPGNDPWLLPYKICRGKSVTATRLTAVTSPLSVSCGPRWLSRYSDSLQVESSGHRIPVGTRFFRTRPERTWGPPSLLYNGYRVSFPGVNRQGREVDHQLHIPPRLKKE